MARSDGKFPHYTKIDIDTENWPKNYYDESRMCPACECRWPASHLFSISPCCDEATRIDKNNAPDVRWPDAVKAFLEAKFDELYEGYNEGWTDEQLAWEDKKRQEDFDFDKVDIHVEDSLTTH